MAQNAFLRGIAVGLGCWCYMARNIFLRGMAAAEASSDKCGM